MSQPAFIDVFTLQTAFFLFTYESNGQQGTPETSMFKQVQVVLHLSAFCPVKIGSFHWYVARKMYLQATMHHLSETLRRCSDHKRGLFPHRGFVPNLKRNARNREDWKRTSGGGKGVDTSARPETMFLTTVSMYMLNILLPLGRKPSFLSFYIILYQNASCLLLLLCSVLLYHQKGEVWTPQDL